MNDILKKVMFLLLIFSNSINGQELFKAKIHPSVELSNSTSLNANIIENNEGNFIINTGDNHSAVIVEMDKFGNINWARKINGVNNESIRATGLILTEDGGFLLTTRGTSTNSSLSNNLFKFGVDGAIEWAKSIGEGAESGAWTTSTSDGGYFMVGTNSKFGSADISFSKLNENGETVFTKIFDIEGNQFGHSAIEMINGDFLILGSLEGNHLVIKINDIGELVFVKTYNFSGNSANKNSMLLLNDGNIMIRGLVENSSKSILVKINGEGDILWAKEHQSIQRMGIIENDEIITFGFGSNLNSPINEIEILFSRITSEGDLIWSKTVSPIDGEPQDMLITEGNFILSLSKNSLEDSLSILKIDAFGNSCGNSSYEFPLVLNDVDISASNIDLFSTDSIEESDYNIMESDVEIESTLTCVLTETNQRYSKEVINVYPNPTFNKIYIDFPHSIYDIKVSIFDLNGKKMEDVYISEKGQNQLEINLSKLTQGYYFINIIGNDINKNFKLIKG